MAERKLVGSSGEHYVCYQLARRGWTASLTRDGLERTDVLAVHGTSRAMVEIQVKTASPMARPSWMLGAKGITPALSEHEWYVFVAMSADESAAPRCYVVPRDHVAAGTWIVHQNWLTHPDATPGKRNAGIAQARVDVTVWQGYESQWEALGQPTGSVPVRLPKWTRDRAMDARVGLPPQHPWSTGLPEW